MTFEDLEDEGAAPLPFERGDLPRRSVPPGGHRALAALSEWTVALETGDRLRLDSLHQYGTYAGTLCGLPLDDEVRAWPVHALLRLAGDMFVACIAVFRSGERFAVVAWFQQAFGTPFSSHVMAHLASLDWRRFSLPWTP